MLLIGGGDGFSCRLSLLLPSCIRLLQLKQLSFQLRVAVAKPLVLPSELHVLPSELHLRLLQPPLLEAPKQLLRQLSRCSQVIDFHRLGYSLLLLIPCDQPGFLWTFPPFRTVLRGLY